MDKKESSSERQTLYQKRLSESGMTFTLAAVLPVVLAAVIALVAGDANRETDWFRYLSYLAPQVCFAAAVAVYFKRTGQPFRDTYRVCNWRYFLVAVVLQFGLLFSLSELNGYFISFLQSLGYRPSESTLPDLSGAHLILAIVVIALLPAVLEETVFRGLLVRNMVDGGWGLASVLIVSGAMFSLMHASPEQTIYQFICGVCFALVAVRSGSPLPTMLAHFLNNAVILVLNATGFGTTWNFSFGGKIGVMVLSAICFAVAVCWLAFAQKRGNKKGFSLGPKEFWLFAGVGILVCVVEWISVLITGFANV